MDRRINSNRRRVHKGKKRGYTTTESAVLTFLTPHKYLTLKYNQTYETSLLTTAGAQQIMNLNSIFDPDRTGSGHQPYGYDTLATLYNRYRPLQTRWKVTFGTSTGNYHFVVLPLNGLLVAAIADGATFNTAVEHPRSRNGIQGGGGAPSTVIMGEIDLAALNGVIRTEYLADDRFEAQIGANPAELMVLYTGVYNPTVSTLTAFFNIEVWYTVDLHDPIALGGS
jgi:hypothetical protein